jgi:hypothetical protein
LVSAKLCDAPNPFDLNEVVLIDAVTLLRGCDGAVRWCFWGGSGVGFFVAYARAHVPVQEKLRKEAEQMRLAAEDAERQVCCVPAGVVRLYRLPDADVAGSLHLAGQGGAGARRGGRAGPHCAAA